jgi:hypothetical protein
MGLPVANFEIVHIPDKLAKLSLKPDFAELSPGPAFASRALGDDYIDLTPNQLPNLDERTLAELYLFDYWIGNSDRILGKQAGNPNALCSIVTGKLAIIDHDSAFDSGFSSDQHARIHFCTSKKDYWKDLQKREEWISKISSLIRDGLHHYWEQIPEAWLVGNFGDLRTTYSLHTIAEQLNHPLLDNELFWSNIFGDE